MNPLKALAFSLGLAACASTPSAAQQPPTISIQRDPGSIVLTWTGNGRLETGPTPLGPWEGIWEARSPHRITQPPGTAYFRVRQVYTLQVARAGTGTGVVFNRHVGIQCGDDCSETLDSGSTVILSATPDPGSTFAGWSGDCTGTADCTVTMDRARSVTATFSGAGVVNPFVNGDFEQGPGVGWQEAPGQIIFPAGNLAGAPPYGGNYAAFLGMDRDGRRQVQLGQRVTLPASQPLFLNFAAWVYSEELCDVPWYDQITLYVNGQVAFQNSQVCSGSGTDGWLRFSVDVTALAGQSAAFVFEIYSADALSSALLLDDIAISDKAWGQ